MPSVFMADDIWPVGVYRRWWRQQRTESNDPETSVKTAGNPRMAAPVDPETAVKTAATLQVAAPVDNDGATVTTANRFNVIDPDNVDTCSIRTCNINL